MHAKKHLAVLVMISFVAVLVSGCIGQEKSGERYFVEGYLSITDHSWEKHNYSFPRYGMVVGQYAAITLTATKYMHNTTGKMAMNIYLPVGMELVDGQAEWIGNDVAKNITIRVRAVQNGKWIVYGYATNLDNGLGFRRDMIVYINDSIEDIESMDSIDSNMDSDMDFDIDIVAS